MSVLVVDDSLTVRMNLTEILDAAALPAVACATSPKRGASSPSSNSPWSSSTCCCPTATASNCCREIRAMPSADDTAVMLLSTEAEVRDRIRGLTTGADEYVGKPYDPSYVVARARELARLQRVGRTAPAQETVLVIDDSLTFREALKAALEAAVLPRDRRRHRRGRLAARRRSAADRDRRRRSIARHRRRHRHPAHPARRGAARHCPACCSPRRRIAAPRCGRSTPAPTPSSARTKISRVILAQLKAVLRSAGAQVASSDGRDGTASLLGPKKILAVDDSETYLQQLADALRADGYEVVLARSGEEALELLAVQPVDCILLDLMMPGIGGRETCRRIKAAPGMRDIPVVMLTAVEDREAMIEGLGAGADDYIAKSSDFDLLRARVLAQIRRKQFEDENAAYPRAAVARGAGGGRGARGPRDGRGARQLVAELEVKNDELEVLQLFGGARSARAVAQHRRLRPGAAGGLRRQARRRRQAISGLRAGIGPADGAADRRPAGAGAGHARRIRARAASI